MNITSISNLLEQFVEVNRNIVKTENVKHRPTIGNMYEGLTAEILKKGIPSELDLKIIRNSFVQGCESEFDLMLVQGTGEKIPFTDNQYRYRVEQVIVIFQVKKNLYSKDLKDSFENLNSLILSINNIKYEKYHWNLIFDCVKSMIGKNILKNSANLNVTESNLFEMIRLDVRLPRRIVLGYEGFKHENTFRNKMVDFFDREINKNKRETNFTPVNFPDLIICNGYSLIKINGMPYSSQLEKNDSKLLYTSSSINPMLFILEIIWTRLCYMYDNLPNDIFGEDLTNETMTPFVSYKHNKVENIDEWNYEFHSFTTQVTKDWEPVYIDMAQYYVIGKLCSEEQILIVNNKKLEKFVRDYGYFGLEDFVRNLVNTRLVWTDGKSIMLLTEKCACAILPTKQIIAAENKSGRLDRWLKNYIKRRDSSRT